MQFWLYNIETKEETIEDNFYWFEHQFVQNVEDGIAQTFYNGDFQIGFLGGNHKTQEQIRWWLLHDMSTIRHASMGLGISCCYDKENNSISVCDAQIGASYNIDDFFNRFDFNLGWEVVS